ncbi:HAD family hydrolase [Psychrilyobacter atlanticus]|uniref:HAD family hydrolase n=1 Tax=Psychrilyobacter atlanticus TaxID=271091 RepID=UPI0004245945|nr:HAD family hydrolase [Psychrilyobacter atlanticus]
MFEMVVFDIDGTLTTDRNNIPIRTIKTIKALKKKGKKVVLATGRSEVDLKYILEKTGIDSFIANNGNLIKIKGETIYANHYTKKEVELIKKICKKSNFYFGLGCNSGIFIPQFKKVYKEYFHEMLNNSKIIFTLPNTTKIESIIIFAEGNIKNCFEKLNFDLIPWGERNFDLVRKNNSKAIAIDTIAKTYNIPPLKIACFGDGINDIEMIKYAGLGVAMGNAVEELKIVADYVTNSVDNDGIYNACKKHNIF